VNFVPGRTPELVLYDENGVEIERMFVDKLKYDELHTLVQSKGFKRRDPNAAAATTTATASTRRARAARRLLRATEETAC
jgi:hypothetical protein